MTVDGVKSYILQRLPDASNDKIEWAITTVLSIFDDYHPLLVLDTTSVVTVADQEYYAVPEGAAKVIEVYWVPTASGDDVVFEVEDSDFYDHPSLRIVQAIKESLTSKWQLGSWRIFIDPSTKVRKLWLSPPPASSGINVPIVYSMPHSSTLEDILPEEEGLFKEGVLLRCQESVLTDKVTSGGFRAGSYAVTSDTGQTALTTKFNAEWKRWLLRLSGGGAGSRT